MDIKDRLKALPNKTSKKETGRPSAFNEPTEKLLIILSKKTAEKLTVIHAQERVKYRQKGITLCKGKLIDIALQEYFKQLGY